MATLVIPRVERAATAVRMATDNLATGTTQTNHDFPVSVFAYTQTGSDRSEATVLLLLATLHSSTKSTNAPDQA